MFFCFCRFEESYNQASKSLEVLQVAHKEQSDELSITKETLVSTEKQLTDLEEKNKDMKQELTRRLIETQQKLTSKQKELERYVSINL